MAYSTVYGYSVHRDCVNFQNGLCTLIGVAVDPNGAACPRFTPRSTTKTFQSGSAPPEARRPSQMYPPQMGQGRPFDRTMGGGRGLGSGRRMRSGRGMGGGRGMSGVRSTDVYPLPMQMRPPGSTARVQKREALTQQLEELETQLKDIRERLKKFR